LAGTFGIAAYTIGYLAKIYSDLFEGTDPEVLEAVGSTGASKLQLVRFVFLPEGANAILTQLLFMLEYNIRASSILGFVGAGGLGFVMQVYLQTLEYRRLASVLLLILVVVLTMDGLSAWIRKRFLLTAQASAHMRSFWKPLFVNLSESRRSLSLLGPTAAHRSAVVVFLVFLIAASTAFADDEGD